MHPDEIFDEDLQRVLDAYHDHILAMMENTEVVPKKTIDAFVKAREEFNEKYAPSSRENE